ncbi:MAG: Hpt domain-containing protein [Lachnospiraceae bacterium]|nr:Hpt domain-containing protein [Lachnospiraceae bacterium]
MPDFNDLRQAGLNIEGAFRYTLNAEKYLAALQRFYRRSEKNLTAIEESAGNRNCEELTILVHALKSNARTIGADSLGDLAEEMENLGKAGEEEKLFSRVDALAEKYRKVIEIIRPYGLMDEVHPASEISAEEAEKTGRELIEAVEDYDDEKALELLQTLMRYPFRFTLINVLKNAVEDIREYEYAEALVKIKRVVSQIED